MSSTAIRRIHADIRELRAAKNPMISAAPLPDNIFEWHFTIHGAPNSDYEGGIYHGRLLLPAEWPMKPPKIIFTTVNGRFEVNTPICLSFSSFHPEEWQPSWGVRTILEAIISFFPIESEGAVGSITCSSKLRKQFARESRKFVCPNCGPIIHLIAPLTEEQIKSYYTSPAGEEDASDVENEKTESVDAASEGDTVSSEVREADPAISQSVDVSESIEEPVEKSVEPAEEASEEPFKEYSEDHSDEPSNEPSSCAKCDCENSLEHIVLSAKFTRGGEAATKDSLSEPETTPVPPPVKSLPATLPEETTEWMKEAAKLGEEVRKRGPTQVPFVPIYVPVVVPVVRAKESEEKVSKKNVCPQVFASLVSLATVLLYYYMILWRH